MKTLKEREWFFSQEKEEFVATNPNPVYDIYRLKTTRQVICDIRIDSGLSLEKETVIGAVADLHFNFCNMNDRNDEELAYTEKCREWLKEQKSVPAAIKALEAADFCDAAVLLGDTLDYMSEGAAELVKKHIIRKYPEIIMVLGGHDITKEMQTKIPDKLPLEEREAYVAAFWPHDIHYYSRVINNKVVVVALNNSMSCYLESQIEKLRFDIDEARKNGRIIIVAQHEPLAAYTEEKGIVPAVIVNGGALKEVNFMTPDIIGASQNNSGVTGEVVKLITENADVIKAVVAGHWHSQFYGEINASYEKDGKRVETVIPEFVISGNPYHEAGFLARIIVK